MKYLLFMLFGSMESFSIILLGVILFRLRLNVANVARCIIIGICLSSASLFLNMIELQSISPFIQMLLIILLSKKLFDIKILHAMLVGIIPYLIYAFTQGMFILILNYYKLIKLSDITPYTYTGYLVQFIGFLLIVIISTYIKKTNEGYGFDPDSKQKKNYKYSNKLLLLLSSSSMLLITGLFTEYQKIMLLEIFIPLFALISLFVILLLYISLKRDQEEFSQ